MSVFGAVDIAQPALAVEFADSVSAVNEKDLALGINRDAEGRVSRTSELSQTKEDCHCDQCGHSHNDSLSPFRFMTECSCHLVTLENAERGGERWLAPPEPPNCQSGAGPAIRSTEKLDRGLVIPTAGTQNAYQGLCCFVHSIQKP